MKTSKLALAGLAVAALLACSQAGEAGQKKKASQTPSPATTSKYTPVTEAADEAQVQEFIKILNETKSPATLVATAVALLPLGDKAKVAVPALLRNAERLKMLDDLGNGNNSRKGELAAALVEVIYAIQSGWTPDSGNPLNRLGSPRTYQAPVVSGSDLFLGPPTRSARPVTQY